MAQIAYRKVGQGGESNTNRTSNGQPMQAEAHNLHPLGGVSEKAEVRKEIPEGNTVGWISRRVASTYLHAKLIESVEPKGSYAV